MVIESYVSNKVMEFHKKHHDVFVDDAVSLYTEVREASVVTLCRSVRDSRATDQQTLEKIAEFNC